VLGATLAMSAGCSSSSSRSGGASTTSTAPIPHQGTTTTRSARPRPRATIPHRTTAPSTIATPTTHLPGPSAIRAVSPPRVSLLSPSSPQPPPPQPPPPQRPASPQDFTVQVFTTPYPFWLHPGACDYPACSTTPPRSVQIQVRLWSSRFLITEMRTLTVPFPGTVHLTFNERGLSLRYRVRCTPQDPHVCEIA